MAKIKNKKRKTADNVHNKKESMHSKKTMNPFEMHINKEKMKVIGRKLKNDKGLPGVSRGKAINKRKHTLLQEYKVQNKSNKFTDKRIGEKNYGMTEEDRVMARFTAVRAKAHSKKSIFNLADDEVLTHKGQTLSEIEKFDDPRSDDEDSVEGDNKSGKLESDFVGDAHFGGGILKRTNREGAKTHKELIEQLIAESKKRKAEKQQLKEATLELTAKLDTEWKDLLPLVSKSKKTEEDIEDKPKVDDYDKALRELRFEARGTVSDRLKSEDEIAKEEKEKLEQLEKERLERMQGFVEDNKNKKPTHRSADDLDDDFVYDSDPDPEYMLSYNDEGASNVKVQAQLNGKDIEEGIIESDKEEHSPQDDEELNNEDNNSVDSGNKGDGASDVEEAESESEDDMSDLKLESSDSENEEPIQLETNKRKLNNGPTQAKKQKIETQTNKLNHEQEDIKTDLLKRKEIMEKARKELPYTFKFPDSYESLQKLFENYSSAHQSVIVERIIKCNHPSLGEGNKDKLGMLFAYLLQYLNDLACDVVDEKSVKNCFEIFCALTPELFDLAQLNQENAHKSILEVIKEKHEDYRKTNKLYPGLEILLFLKLVSVLFSTSDFRHQVVTPCFVFIEQILTKCRIKSKRDISYGLFLSTLALEYTTLSKRYLPAAVNFLSGILHMAIPKTSVRLIKVLPPFKPTNNQLVLNKNHSNIKVPLKMEVDDLLEKEIDGEFRIRTVYMVANLLREYSDNFKELSSNVQIFQSALSYLLMIPTDNYPVLVKKCLQDLIDELKKQKLEKKLEYVVLEAKRPKALRLYEPKIIEIYDGKRYKVQSKEKAERDKLLHKLKKETKGALREIRRDKAFLGRVKIQQRIKGDKERADKVKKIYSEASVQQSELNSFDRAKKRK